MNIQLKPGNFPGRPWALLFARLVLGLIFFMAGFWKVFQLGPLQHARKYFLPFADTFLPVWSLWAVGVTIPFVELIAGALVILGLRVRTALIALGFVLLVVTFGHLLKEPLYEFHTHVIPRLALLLFVLGGGPVFARGDPRAAKALIDPPPSGRVGAIMRLSRVGGFPISLESSAAEGDRESSGAFNHGGPHASRIADPTNSFVPDL